MRAVANVDLGSVLALAQEPWREDHNYGAKTIALAP